VLFRSLRTADLDVLAEALAAQLADSPDFFEQEPVVIDLSQLQAQDAHADIDFTRLRQLLARHQTQPVAVRGGSDAHHRAARAAGMSITALPAAPLKPAAAPAAATPSAPPPAPAEAAREALGPATAPAGTLVVDKPLRSGQQVYARGGDVIVTALVSHGAEVIADGNVHVYAPLRGKAIAGARGDAGARIFTTCLEAELLAIAGIYRTSEVALPAEVVGKAARISLQDGKRIVIEPI
jgi:septum site-determining protein MinC